MKPKKTRQTEQVPRTGASFSCKLVRKRLFGPSAADRERSSLVGRFSGLGIDLDAPWVQEHMSTCMRCQRRFAVIGKVKLGLSLLKSQSHSLDLLSKANARTVQVLRRDLRHTPQADELKSILPRPTLTTRLSVLRHSLAHMAACVTILILSKVGIFSSIEQTQKQGHKVVRHYYDNHLGADLSDDMFGDA